MARRSILHRRSALGAAALWLLHSMLAAQTSPGTVTVTGRTDPPLSIGGFGGTLATSPMQGTVLSAAQLRDWGIVSLSGLTKLEAALADAYNSPGYWSQLSARGYVLDNRANYRRDGLPINAETAISLVNKERVEVLFGLSGIQAGTSSPGGLVNLVVKRPTERVRDAAIEISERGTTTAQVDLAQRFGAEQQFGARLNVGAANLRPQVHNAQGHNRLWALALDWQPAAGSKLDFEIESSHQQQPSLPGFSLLGNRIPDARSIDPRTNLNNQPWSLPVVLDGDTASLRWKQQLGADWSATVHAATQRLRSDDRVAFPFGCYEATTGTYYADRYCPDGSFDLYDFRSDRERRRVEALDVHAEGVLRTGSIEHRVSAGMLVSRSQDRFERLANNYTGRGHIDGTGFTPAAPALTEENTLRDERSRELYLRDAMTIATHWELWLGLRHTRLERRSVRTDGSRFSDYAQSFSTPWLALSYRPTPELTTYVSWGQGIESEVVPNRGKYNNRGVVLPALKSRQWEAGVKAGNADRSVALTWFDIRRPVTQDFCDADDSNCLRQIDGQARHRGIDATAQWRGGPWSARAGVEWLDAQRSGSRTPEINGNRPTNVPRQNARVQLGYDVSPTLALQARGSYEGRRAVLPDNSIWLTSWTRFDLGATWRAVVAGHDLRWRVGVDNVTDRRAWRESPYQFGHAYLYPLMPRTWRVSAATSF